MFNLSTTRIVTSLELVGKDLQKCIEIGLREVQNLIGMEMRNCWENMQKYLKNCLREVVMERDVVKEVVQSMKEILLHNQHSSLLLTKNHNNPLRYDCFKGGFALIETAGAKSCYIEFQIQLPYGLFTTCRVLPPKDLISILGKNKRQHELKSISMDPLKLLLVYVFTTFLEGDRVILPVILEWEADRSSTYCDLKELW